MSQETVKYIPIKPDIYEYRDDGEVLMAFEIYPSGNSEYREWEIDIPLGEVFHCYEFDNANTLKLIHILEDREKNGLDTHGSTLCEKLMDLWCREEIRKEVKFKESYM